MFSFVVRLSIQAVFQCTYAVLIFFNIFIVIRELKETTMKTTNTKVELDFNLIKKVRLSAYNAYMCRTTQMKTAQKKTFHSHLQMIQFSVNFSRLFQHSYNDFINSFINSLFLSSTHSFGEEKQKQQQAQPVAAIQSTLIRTV